MDGPTDMVKALYPPPYSVDRAKSVGPGQPMQIDVPDTFSQMY